MTSTDLELILKFARELGLQSLFGQLFLVGAFLFLLKKYFFRGATTFIKEMWTGWLSTEKDRIKTQAEIEHAMTEARATSKEMNGTLVSTNQDTKQILIKIEETITQAINLLQKQERDQIEHTATMRGHVEEQHNLLAVLTDVERSLTSLKEDIDFIMKFYSS